MELDSSVPGDDDSDVVEAIERDEDLSSGKVPGFTHEEVMEAVRRALSR